MRVSLDSQPGHPDGPSLDWGGCTDRLAVVLDGVTESEQTGCRHGTEWFVHQLGARLLLHLGDDGTAMTDGLAQAIDEVAWLHRETCDLSHPGSPSTTVAVVRRRGDRTDYLVLSDAVVVIAYPEADPLAVVDNSVKAVTQHLVSQASGDLTALIELQQGYRNTPEGYWIAQTSPDAAYHALTGTRVGSTGAVVASDGAALLVTEFGLLNWRSYVELAYQQGAAGIIAATRAAELDDPECTRWPRYKRHDDATAVVCRIGNPSSD
jgi:hypothetical protein